MENRKWEMEIISMKSEHWQAVRSIYEQGIATGIATLSIEAPEWEEWNVSHLPHSRLVALEAGEVVGWAALSPASGRCVYGGVGEVSVYIGARHRGKGVGLALLKTLILLSEQNGIWTLQSGIFARNIGSIRLHQKAGFQMLGTRKKLGKLKGVWEDIVLMEKRSEIVGID